MTERDLVAEGWLDERGQATYPTHRAARLPRFGGRHGDRVKGSVHWDGSGYRVTYSYLLGYETTAKASDVWENWYTALGQYREHDRYVRQEKIDNYRESKNLAPLYRIG